jgi:hypothetical protein
MTSIDLSLDKVYFMKYRMLSIDHNYLHLNIDFLYPVAIYKLYLKYI